MAEELPKRKMPEFKIGKEQMDNLKTVAAVTDVLSKNPDLAKEIANIFKEVAEEKERELVKRVTELLAEKVKTVSPEQIQASFDYWYIWYFPPETMSFMWQAGWRTYPAPRVWMGWVR